ncbi:peptide chain release factor 2 [Vagococcus lutrae]|uniref:peptide chain release factor 2 n=1 Tax=Vagococcus lutrae TaxID=81947 RepID=UPI001C96CBEC|nr:peptide chain release factor 2 [Vagococcus lutrae]QZN89333.1 peptide chain release factor 2 [Vagococcus lutrae]
MELSEIRQQLERNQQQVSDFRGSLDLEEMEERIANLEYQMTEADFWNDNQKAQTVISELNDVKARFQSFQKIATDLEELMVLYEMVVEEPDEELEKELAESLATYQEEMNQYELEQLLSEPYDANNAIMEIHPGAGGTESQDWGSMLLRMYTRWCASKGFDVTYLDYHDGEEAGIKSVTLQIKGHNAYGYLKSETGVHRLVRLSPFDTANRRHTSFCSINVMPELTDDVEVEIKPDDLKVDTYRASGAGGQHVNKTESAVRITHLPTGIVVASQAQRSQLQNREQAMATLKAKLYQLEMDKKAELASEIRGETKEIGWSSQIRSYVFHPYSMVKDHRTNYEVGDVQSVMDGDLDKFMDAYLRQQLS